MILIYKTNIKYLKYSRENTHKWDIFEIEYLKKLLEYRSLISWKAHMSLIFYIRVDIFTYVLFSEIKWTIKNNEVKSILEHDLFLDIIFSTAFPNKETINIPVLNILAERLWHNIQLIL